MLKFATANSADNLKKLIAEFYFCKPEEIELKEGGAVVKNGRELSTKWTVKKAVGYFIRLKR